MSEQIYNKITVVNEQDEVIGAMCMRDEIAEGMIRRAARVLVYDNAQRVLIQKRGLSIMKPGLLDHSASGHVDAGERYLEAAVRELSEETGINNQPLSILLPPYRCYEFGTADFFASLYKVTIPEDYPPIFPPEEVAALVWYTESELTAEISNNRQLFTPAFLEDWEQNRSAFFC